VPAVPRRYRLRAWVLRAAVEPAELAEGGEAAEKECVRCQAGTDRIIGPGGGSLAEAVLVAAHPRRSSHARKTPVPVSLRSSLAVGSSLRLLAHVIERVKDSREPQFGGDPEQIRDRS
jgi:hypothetical protein